jgi:hypothetical protein
MSARAVQLAGGTEKARSPSSRRAELLSTVVGGLFNVFAPQSVATRFFARAVKLDFAGVYQISVLRPLTLPTRRARSRACWVPGSVRHHQAARKRDRRTHMAPGFLAESLRRAAVMPHAMITSLIYGRCGLSFCPAWRRSRRPSRLFAAVVKLNFDGKSVFRSACEHGAVAGVRRRGRAFPDGADSVHRHNHRTA